MKYYLIAIYIGFGSTSDNGQIDPSELWPLRPENQPYETPAECNEAKERHSESIDQSVWRLACLGMYD